MSDQNSESGKHRAHLRRNVIALWIDSASFGMAMGFMGYSTVLPALAAALTNNSEPLVGLINSLFAGMWLLPQLPAGRWMASHPRKKPALVYASVIGRSGIAVLAIALAARLHPIILFVMLAVLTSLFRAMDAVASVAWFDLISKVIPINLRGRVLGALQAGAFSLQFIASFIVVWALGSTGPEFPTNYALLFGIAAAGLLVSLIALTTLIEHPADVTDNISAQMKIGAHVRHVLKSDRNFRLIVVARLLIGGVALAIPFYVLHATEVLQVPQDSIGLFLAAQTIGGVIASVIFGAISERRGPRVVVRISMVIAAIPPIGALVLSSIGVGSPALAQIGYVIVFAAMGATDGSMLLGFGSFVLDIAPPSERTAYMGLANTITGILVIAPTIGGFILQSTSYPVLFSVAGLGPLVGLWLAMKLPQVKYEG